jgi:hypothetical protein
MSDSKIVNSSTIDQSNLWCPSPTDVEPYLQVTLSNLTFITYIEIKSKIPSDINYRLEYTRDNQIDQYTIWRSYRSLNNQQEKIVLDPPMIAKHVRLSLKQTKSNLCIQFELFGCIFTDGVASYSMLQGSNQLEDDTYDGQYDNKQRYLYGKKTFSRITKNYLLIFIKDGLGQLSDGQTGPDNREDAGGFKWVS